MRSGRTTPAVCPTCKEVLDGVTDPVGDAMPAPGDVTMCMYCTSVSLIGEDMQLTLCTLEQIAEFPDEIKAQLVKQRRILRRIVPKEKQR